MNSRSTTPLALAALAISLLSIALIREVAPKFVWNGSQSAPPGLYRIRAERPRIGDLTLVAPPDSVRTFIEERGYLPPDTSLIKRVAALEGDEICREGTRILIDKVVVAYARLEDSEGRVMPQWVGCFTLKRDEVFLLNDHESSLDGRYFGATNHASVIGVAAPVWTFSPGN